MNSKTKRGAGHLHLMTGILLFISLCIPVFTQAQNELNQKLMMGYQGWFLCNGDQSAPNEWRHWFNSTTTPSAANLNIDMWPDMSEYTQTYATNMTYSDGSAASLFSSHDLSTTNVHFKWMKDYNIYGVYLQRFLGEAVNDPRFFQVRNHVLENVMTASQIHGRRYAIMYDLSGVPDDGNLYNKLINDWEYLVDNYSMTQTNEYVKQGGLPVIALWGIGFSGRGLNPATFQQIIDYFHTNAAPQYRAYVVGGVPSQWRTLSGDSESDPAWMNVYHSLDMISPWTVGRYSDNNGIDNWKNQRIIPDLADCNNNGVDYMPVIWPGFSWYNLHDGPLNQIPRNGGNFYWRQAYNALDAGAEFIYVAMFDEVDEATAMFKIAETQQDVPVQGNFVSLDADGTGLPNDWYLRLADETQKMLDNTIPLSSQITIDPQDNPDPDPEPGMPDNPFIKHMFTADPSAHVWDDGRLYVYPSHDIAPPQGADKMDQYHVFSTNNMVDWVDHGEILSSDDVAWGRPEGGFMWAPDCAYKDGTYYFYFPHPTGSGDAWNSTWKIGVATSSSPASDFTVQGYIPGLESLIDPAVFIDDDGQAYFYYGGGGVCKGGKLKDNMMEIDGQMQNMQGLVDFHEATWVHKRNGVYYLSYSDNHDVGDEHNRMRYATSTSPLGPWTYRGIYMDPTDSYTNHGSIVEYKGQWYAFYHNSSLSGHDWLRSIAVDKLFYNPDGTIQKVIQTKGHGSPYGGTAWAIPGMLQAEDYDLGGQAVSYSDSDTINHGGQYRPNEFVDIGAIPGGGYHVGWLGGSEWLEYTVNVATAGTYTMEFRVASEDGGSISIEFDGEDKTGSITVPTTSDWQTYTTISQQVNLEAGEQYMMLKTGGAFNIDYINITGGNPPQNQTPYLGLPVSLPGTVEAENFDNGGEGIAYHDNDASNQGGQYRTGEGVDIESCSEGGYNVGWTNSGEWVEYTVDVATSGTYDITLRTASPNGSSIHIEFEGVNKTGTMSVPASGGWQTWTNVTATGIQLNAGEQVMRVYMNGGEFNINYIEVTSGAQNVSVTGVSVAPTSVTLNVSDTHQLTATVSPSNASNQNVTWSSSNTGVATVDSSGQVTAVSDGMATITVTTQDGGYTASSNITVESAPSSQSPYGGTPAPIPGTIEVENFDLGGEGVAYHDTNTANEGGQYRTSDGVDVESCSEGGYNIGWTNAGEWLEYTVNVASTGSYDFDFRVASTLSGGTFHVEFDGVNKTGTITSQNTGAWQNWTTVSVDNVSLDAGQQIMRIALDNPNHNIDKVSISASGSTNQPPTANAGADQTLSTGTTSATLSGSGSDPDSDPISYSWSQVSGPSATISNGSSASVSVTGLSDGNTYVFRLTVSDGEANDTDDVQIIVNSGGTGGTTYRIRNVWQNTYLADGGDRVTYSASPSGSSYEWVLEDVGEGYQELRNVTTDEYMHIENLTGYVQCTSRTWGWYSSRWAVEDAGNGEVRIRNAWQSNNYVHVENLQGHAQHGTIYMAWGSAKWVLEPVSGARMAGTVEGQIAESERLNVYPNPFTSDVLTVEFQGDLSQKSTIYLYDMTGVLIRTEKLLNGKIDFSRDDLSSGVYLLQVQSDNQFYKRKIVVKK